MSIPKYLYSLPEGILPPTQTKIQDLPFNDLTWENFERLVLRYVEHTGKLEHCHLYGNGGQKQEGIDLFIRHNSDEKYTAYQCKRYKKYSATKVKKAVEEFRNGKWIKQCKSFYICTSCDLSEKKISDEIENQTKKLRDVGVELQVLDQVKLSNKLKILPQIIYDFFGREWTRLFCGEEYLHNIIDRLDPSQISLYRDKLGSFYSTLFENHESSLRNISGQKSTPKFVERYIPPEIVHNISFDSIGTDQSIKSSMRENYIDSSSVELLDDWDVDYENLGKIKDSYVENTTSIENRLCAIDWIGSEPNTLIIGGPGSGKSALLKYIILGLLDQVEIDNKIFIQNKNTLIPVWLPFGYWSNFLENTPNSSLVDCLHSWFLGMAHEDLWPLIKTAINDDRLLLVVDGLDEWKSEQSALVCLHKLSVFLSERNAASIMSSRPSGIDKLGLAESNWSTGYLVGLSSEQQNNLIKSCIGFRLKNQTNVEESLLQYELKKLTHELVSEISVSQDLSDLASVPLLLYMLIHLKAKNISLPHSRFQVYKELIDDLVKTQPQRRRTAAQVINKSSVFSESELISILAKLAYDLHVLYPHGSVPISIAQSLICDYLSDENKEFGFRQREAKRYSEEFINISESEVGILVKKSPSEIGFFHRALQEFLTAYYLSTESDRNQEKALSTYMFNRQWKDVFLGFFTLLQRHVDIEKLVNFVNNFKCNQHENMAKEVLLAEVAFGDNKCSANTAKAIAQKTFRVIESGSHFPHRSALLNILLSGFRSNKLNEEIVKRIKEWIPSNNSWLSNVFDSIEECWPADDLTFKLLFKAIDFDDLINKRAAGRVIIKKFGTNNEMLSCLMKKIKATLCFETRMALIEVVIRGWTNSKEANSLCKNLASNKAPVADLLIILHETLNNIKTDSNRWKLLDFLGHQHFQLDYHWSPIIKECIELSYLDDEIKNICINRAFNNNGSIDIDFAIGILTSHYYKDDEVLKHIINDLKTKHPKTLMGLNRREKRNIENIIQYSPDAHDALEERIINEPVLSYLYYDLFRSEKIKQHLIQEVQKAGSLCFWATEALLSNWGIEDLEVKQTIADLVARKDSDTSTIAHLYPDIFPNKNECYEKLIALLEADSDPSKRKRYDFIVNGILKVADDEQCEKAVKILLKKVKGEGTIFINDDLVLLFGMSKITKNITDVAIKHIYQRDGNLALVAAIFNNDDSIRKKIVERLSVLPTSLQGKISTKLSQVNTDQVAWKLLSNYDNEIDPTVKTTSSIGYYSSPLSTRTESQIEKNIDKLKKQIIAVGPDYLDRRQAAFCGFIAMRELGQLESYEKFKDIKKSIPILLERSIRPNEVYFGYLAKNWDYIHQNLNLEDYDPIKLDSNSFFTNIAPHISNDSPLKDKFRDYLYNSKLGSNDRILMAASKFIPRETLLLKMCFHALGLNITDIEQEISNSYRESLVSLHILEQQFYEDARAKSFLSEIYDKNLYKPDLILVVAYSIGFRDASFIKIIKSNLKNQPMWLPAHFHLISSHRGNKKKIEEIFKVFPHLSNVPRQYSKYFCKTMSGIVNSSESLYKEILKSMSSDILIQDKLQLLMLLVYVKGVNSDIRKIAMELYNNQRKKHFYDVFFDVTNGCFSTSLAALTNILYEK